MQETKWVSQAILDTQLAHICISNNTPQVRSGRMATLLAPLPWNRATRRYYMRLLRIVLLLQVMLSTVAYGQDRAFIVGETQDCFAGKAIHPTKVDIYLLDPLKSPEIEKILNDMEKQ